MPNWCMNTLSISGPNEDIKRFRGQARGPTQTYNDIRSLYEKKWDIHDDIRVRAMVETLPDPGDVSEFSFHALYPVPEDYRCFPYDDTQAVELGEKLGTERPCGGYSWEANHWGCKWGASDVTVTIYSDTDIEYSFSTPWGPPNQFLAKITRDWPTLTFYLQYDEPGMGFKGSSEWEEGECVWEDCNSYQEEDEEYEED